MAISAITTRYGPAAHDRLAEAIARYKGDDPLRPVCVIVPSNHMGIAARRSLGRRGGIAGVTFLTPYRLAELLGAPRVAGSGRRPVSTPVLAGAVRAVLHADPGHFAGVHTHPATERSLVRAHRALSEVPEAGLVSLASTSSRTADVVRVHREIGELLGQRFSDEQDLVTAAVASLEAGAPVVAQLGPAILFLPQRISTSQIKLLREFGDRHTLEIIAGTTGCADADAAVSDSVKRLGADWPTTDPVDPAIADRALSVSDADDEVRHAVRLIVDAARRDVPLGRCAILYGTAQPYARLVSDALDAAKISWFGTSVRTAESSLLGRSLLALLALPDHNLARRDVAAWLAGAPIRGTDNRPVPVAAWERASRSAGVVSGIGQWDGRLTRLADDLDADAANLGRDDAYAWRAERLAREAGHARDLTAFVTQLNSDLDPGPRGTTWSGLAGWCRSLVRRYLGGERLREQWPDDERAAGQRIDAAIDRLGDLDGVDPAPSAAAFRRALELQLADDLGRHGTFGAGVLVGNVALAVGLELDVTILLGLAEGSFPPRRGDDPLLPDRVRAVAGRDLPPRADAVHDDHRALLAVLAAADESTLIFPRGDLRRSTERAPSRWLLDTAQARDGVRPSSDDLDRQTGDWFSEVPSFIAGLRSSSFPAHDQEYDVRALLDATEAGDDINNHPLVDQRAEVRRGIDLIDGRLSRRFTRFDGNLATDGDLRGAQLPVPTDADQISSATRLETWAKCPHAYFVRYILGVNSVEDPEEQYRISPLVLGSLVHDVLDQWLAEALENETIPAPDAPWTEDDLTRLLQLGAEAADHLQARGMAGRAVYWQRDRQVLIADLAEFTAFETTQRAAWGARPIATELSFGMPGTDAPPIAIDLGNGRSMRLRGAIDRVDETRSGDLVVIDYKTGSTRGYGDLSAEDPTPGGSHLQLVLYANAARQVLDRTDAVAQGAYWFVARKGGFQTIGYPITEEVEEIALATISRIVDGIASGLFPPHPAKPKFLPWVDCDFCEPDGLGLSHQYADWMRLQEDPDLSGYLEVCGDDA